MALSGTTSLKIDRDRLGAPGTDACLTLVEIRSDETGLTTNDLPTELSELSIFVLYYPRRIPSLKAFVVELH